MAFVLGIVIVFFQFYFILPISLLVVIFISLFYTNKGKNRWKLFLPFVFFLLGALRMQVEDNVLEKELAYGLQGDVITVNGTVISIEQSAFGAKLVLNDCNIIGRGQNIQIRNIQVQSSNELAYLKIGNEVICEGSISPVSYPRNQGEFHQAFYYYSKKISYEIKSKSIKITNEKSNRYRETIRQLSLGLQMNLDQVAESDSGIYKAVLLGEKADLTEEIKDLYQRNGISHLLAISGLHMSLFGLSIYTLMRKTGADYHIAAVVSSIIILIYIELAGGSTSVIRAGIGVK